MTWACSNKHPVETVTAKLAALPPKPYFDNFEDYDDAWSNRTYALTKYNARKRTKEPRFNLNTPSILLVNKEIYAEAIHELRRAPLVIDRNMSKMFDRHSLTLAHFVPLPSLQKIEHLLFTMKNCAKDFKSIMYDGAKITKDMNKGKVRQKAYWKGVLFGAGEKVLDDPAIRKITFEKLCDEPLILDVKDDEYGGEVVSQHIFLVATACVLTSLSAATWKGFCAAPSRTMIAMPWKTLSTAMLTRAQVAVLETGKTQPPVKPS